MCAELHQFDFFCTKLGAMQRFGPRINLPYLNASFYGQSDVFVHLPDDRVFTGHLKNVRNRNIPFWVEHPNQLNNSRFNVYMRIHVGRGLVSNLELHEHPININDAIPEEPYCFILTGINTILATTLYRYNLEEIPDTSRPRVFVRMPDSNNTVYVGKLDNFRGHRPSWLF